MTPGTDIVRSWWMSGTFQRGCGHDSFVWGRIVCGAAEVALSGEAGLLDLAFPVKSFAKQRNCHGFDGICAVPMTDLIPLPAWSPSRHDILN